MRFPTKGSLSDSKFIEILKDAAQSGLTGMIRLENGPIIKVIYFQRGTISFASSNEKADRLTEVLKRAGKLTPEQVQDAQARLKPNVSLGKTLVELGYISAKDLLWGARAQVDGILHQLLFWNQGKYQVLEGTLPREIIHLNLPVASVIFEGIMKTQNREWILQHIGSPEAIYAIAADFEEQNQTLKLPVSDVSSKLNGKRSLHEIAQMSGKDTFELCKTVVALEYLDVARSIQDEPLQMTLIAPQEEFEPAPEESPLSAPKEEEPEPEPQSAENADVQHPQEPDASAALEGEAVEKCGADDSSAKLSLYTAVASGRVAPTTSKPNPNFSTASAHVDEPVATTIEPEAEIAPAPEPVMDQKVAMQDVVVNPQDVSIPPPSTFNWKPLVTILLVVTVAGLGAFYYSQSKNQPADKPMVKPVKRDKPVVSTATEPPVVPAPLSSDLPIDTPLSYLRDGKVSDAAKSWNDEFSKKKDGYSIQVVIACQEKTVMDTYQLLNYSEEIIVLPLSYKGQSCYRVLFGQFSSRTFAHAAIKNLPDIFVRQASPANVVVISKVLS